MTLSVAKIWTAVVLFAAVLVLAAVATLNMAGRIRTLNEKVAELNKLYAAEKQTHGYALDQANTAAAEKDSLSADNTSLNTENAALKTQNQKLKAENEKLTADLSKLNLNQVTALNKFTIAVDGRLDPEVVSLVKRYFDALAAGDLYQYRATLGNPDNADLLGYFETYKNMDLHITSISVGEGILEDRLQNGGYYVEVFFTRAGKTGMADLGVTKKGGLWVVYMND